MRTGSLGRALLATGVAISVLPIVGADPAYACSCVRTDEQQRYEQATHVFKGTVIAAQGAAPTEGEATNEPVLYTFDVISTYKGRVTDPQKVSTPGNSAACGVELDGDGPFLVFASREREEAGSGLVMNVCGGTRPIGESDEPTFGRTAPEPAEQEPDVPAPAAPAAPSPAAPAEPEEQQGLTSTVIENLGTLLDELAALADRNPPPGG